MRKLIPFTIEGELQAVKRFLRRLADTLESKITSDLHVLIFLEFNFLIAFLDTSFPISEKLYKYGFYLPSGLTLKPENIEKVAEILKRLIR